MEKVVVNVEYAENNFSCYLEDLQGCVATGDTFKELRKNIEEAVEFHLDGMREDGDDINKVFDGEYQFVYKFDTQSLLQYYSHILTYSGLSKLTNINQRQLQRYASGASKPRVEQIDKIEKALHQLSDELSVVEL